MTVTLRVRRNERWRFPRQYGSLQRSGAYSKRQLRDIERRWVVKHWRAVAAVLAGSAVLAAPAWFLLPGSAAGLVSGVLLASAWWWLKVLMLQETGAMRFRQGATGEEFTNDELRRLRRHGWTHVNHVSFADGDIDHVAVGPGGVVVLETKYSADWMAEAHRLADHAHQVKRQARRIATWSRPGALVIPVVVLWGAGSDDVLPNGTASRDGVTFCTGRTLREHLRSLERTVDNLDQTVVLERLKEYLPRRDKELVAKDGPYVRPMEALIGDACVVVGVALACVASLVAVSSVSPSASVAASVVVAAASLGVRLRWCSGRRLLSMVLAGCVGVAAWWAAFLGTAVVIDTFI